MASIKKLKKELNNVIIDAIDECYSIQLYQKSKKNESDNLIDEIVNFRDQIIKNIYKANKKSEFKKIIDEIEEKSELFFDKINELY